MLLRKPPSRVEILNDVDGDVVNFWRCLRDRYDDLVSRLQMTPYARDEYESALHAAPTDDPVERARRWFVITCQGFNGSNVREKFGWSHSGQKHIKASEFSRRVDTNLAHVAARIRNVEIDNTDALKMLERWDHPDTCAYLDPPYLGSTRTNDGGYRIDQRGDEFHVRLLEAVQAFQGCIVLSGYASDLYDSLGWHRIDWDVQAPTATRQDFSDRRTESVWLNYDPSAQYGNAIDQLAFEL